jgi:hypothetical protein
MPWLIGDETSARALETAHQGVALSELIWSGPKNRAPAYLGYLLDGFSADLALGRFRPERVLLGFRAGWKAVAVTARTPERALAHRLGPYVAPAAPRPYPNVPLGFTLFCSARLCDLLGESIAESHDSLHWAARLTALIDPGYPVFCDPVLELNLSRRSPEEEQACVYDPPSSWSGAAKGLRALWGAAWQSATPAALEPADSTSRRTLAEPG